MAGPLTGLKVLDFSSLLPGPYATMLLASLGADVLHVTSKVRRDVTADQPPVIRDDGLTAARAWLGRNKRSIALNLKNPQAIEIIKQLLREYDILVEQFRPGVMTRMGLGYETLHEEFPELIYCSITGYGQTGPLAQRAGHDINYLARSGLIAYSGRREGGPSLMGIQLADVAAGSENAVIGILSAVIHRTATGVGQHIDVSMLDGAAAFNGIIGAAALVNHKDRKREDGLLNGGALYDFYETADGRFLSFGGLEPKFFASFCKGIGHEELIPGGVFPKDPAVKELVRSVLREKTLDDWMTIFESLDACVEPVLTPTEALGDEQLVQRGMVTDVPLRGSGQSVRQLGVPLRFSESAPEYRFAGELAGADTEDVLRALGYSKEEIAGLTASGTIE